MPRPAGRARRPAAETALNARAAVAVLALRERWSDQPDARSAQRSPRPTPWTAASREQRARASGRGRRTSEANSQSATTAMQHAALSQPSPAARDRINPTKARVTR